MLVLTRTEGDRVRLEVPPGSATTVILLDCLRVAGRKTRWGLTMPDHVRATRDEAINKTPAKRRS